MQHSEILLTTNQKAFGDSELLEVLQFLRDQCRVVSLTGRDFDCVEFGRIQSSQVWVAIGGDGTLNGVVNSVMRLPAERRPSICYLPFGTGNDFARTVGLETAGMMGSLVEAFSEDAHFTPVSVGRCNDTYFMNMASGGMFATVTPETSSQLKNLAGRWSYFISGLSKVLDHQAIGLQLNGGELDQAVGFFVANARYAGGGIQVSSSADPFVPRLEYLQVPNLPAQELIALGLELQKENPDLSTWPVRKFSVDQLRLNFQQPVPITLDGEQVQVTQADFAVVPDALRIFVPRERSPS